MLGLCLSIPAPAATIVWVSFHPADNTPGSGAAGAGFTTATDKEYTDLLKANGFTVVRYVTTGTPDAALLNAADLVIISRSVGSANYQDAAATTWNTTITAPMMILGGYVIRQNRMGFSTGNTIPDITGDITLTANDPKHPIFAGIPLIRQHHGESVCRRRQASRHRGPDARHLDRYRGGERQWKGSGHGCGGVDHRSCHRGHGDRRMAGRSHGDACQRGRNGYTGRSSPGVPDRQPRDGRRQLGNRRLL